MSYLDNTGLAYFWSKLKALFAAKQDTLVSGTNIKTVNNQSLLGTGNITAGIDNVSSPQDGTLIITLSNGDAVTVDLNHNHPQYPKYVHLEDESDMPASPDSDTIYLIDGEGGGSSYVLPAATASSLGGVKVGSVISTPAINAISSTSGRYYALQCDSSGSAFVNVPWEAGSGGGGTTVSWGTESNNTVPLTVGGTSKTLILSSAKVTSLSSSSTDNQVPSAKCVYDLLGNIETLLAAL